MQGLDAVARGGIHSECDQPPADQEHEKSQNTADRASDCAEEQSIVILLVHHQPLVAVALCFRAHESLRAPIRALKIGRESLFVPVNSSPSSLFLLFFSSG